MASPRATRAPSIASSTATTHSISLPFLPRYTPKPEPAYVSPAAAADFVAHRRNEADLDQVSPPASPTLETAVFADKSLALLNAFLDSLLYNFLAKAQSSSLRRLRPAIAEVLKVKLARDALASADEELEGLVGEADLDHAEDSGRDTPSYDWHLEMAFKRMRLRVMVFIRLGDFDDEDEDRFLGEEDDVLALEEDDLHTSPAAVYLAGVLEHIAERALAAIGDAVFRTRQGKRDIHTPVDEEAPKVHEIPKPFLIQEADVEKLTLNPTLGRLWRTWRKNYRTMHPSSGRPYSRGTPSPSDGSFHKRLSSLNEGVAIDMPPSPLAHRGHDRQLSSEEVPEGDVLEHDIAANIPLPHSDNDVKEIETIELPDQEVVAAMPLPMSDNDANEIEIPGLAREIQDETDEHSQDSAEASRRPISVLLSWLTPFSWADHVQPATRPQLKRLRSNSVPSRNRPAFMGADVFTPTEELQEPEYGVLDSFPKPSSRGESKMPARVLEDTKFPAPRALERSEGLQLQPPVEVESQSKPFAPDEDFDAYETPSEVGPIQLDGEPADEPADETRLDKAPIQEPVKEPKKVDGNSNKTGIFAGTVAGIAALVGGTAAVVAGSSASKAEQLQTELTPSSDAPAEKEDMEATREVTSVDSKHAEPGSTLTSTSAPAAQIPSAPSHSALADPQPNPRVETGSVQGTDPRVDRKVSVGPTAEVKAPSTASPPPRKSSLGQNAAVAVGLAAGTGLGVATAAALAQSARQHGQEASKPPAVPEKDAAKSPKQSPVQLHDAQAIGVARTSDVPVPYENAAPSPGLSPEPQRSYHLPGSQSPKSFQLRSDGTLVDKNAASLPGTTIADPKAAGSGTTPRRGPSPLRAETKSLHDVPNESFANDVPHNTPFYHPKPVMAAPKQQQVKSVDENASRQLPPLKTSGVREGTASTESLARPGSATAKSATSTIGGHSSKDSTGDLARPGDKQSLEESRQRDFDTLLNNDKPVKYTLTPEDLRSAEGDQPASTSRASALAEIGSPSPRIVASTAAAAAASGPATGRSSPREPYTSNQLPNGRKPGVPRVSEYRRSAALASLNSRPDPMNTRVPKSGFMPREPRVTTDNTADLADYMQTTAPPHVQEVLPLSHSASSSRLNGSREPARIGRSASHQKLIARDPDIKHDGSGELVEFIRQGPPGAERTQHRTAAPSRVTKDTEEFGVGDFAASLDSSFGTKDLPSTKAMGPSSNRSASNLGSGAPPIVKKQRRVKDPYAIDTDDEDDHLTSLPGEHAVQKPHQESLADFLRNAEPPSGNSPTPINGSTTAASRYANGTPAVRPTGRSVNTGQTNLSNPSPRSAPSLPDSGTGAVTRPKFEARAAGATRNGFGGNGFYYSTNDMADFLKSSGPVESMGPSPHVPLQRKPSKRGHKFWSQA